ncbi:hypothetical protein ACFQYP_18340 [Nonomuraea antimicrobica]
MILALGEYRGTYNSAYVGVATALAGALWLTLGGFYVVRKGIARDEETRVGQILAATPSVPPCSWPPSSSAASWRWPRCSACWRRPRSPCNWCAVRTGGSTWSPCSSPSW